MAEKRHRARRRRRAAVESSWQMDAAASHAVRRFGRPAGTSRFGQEALQSVAAGDLVPIVGRAAQSEPIHRRLPCGSLLPDRRLPGTLADARQI